MFQRFFIKSHLLRYICASAAIIVLNCMSLVVTIAVAEERLQFNRDIRPLLSAACFRCHGLDAHGRQGELRLDTAEGASTPGASGAQPLVAGDLDASEVWLRINSDDPDLTMPPPDSNRKLSDTEKETIKRWIEQGAAYQTHWAFAQFDEPAKTSPTNTAPHELIDNMLDSVIQTRGLNATNRTDKATLLRRLSFTLTGLPPTRSELELFNNDSSPQAYEKMVDHYLASAHYGEEMAKHWLDVARYGDTHGLHLDNERAIWAYRDWVIQAMNQNMPFNQFTIEQLAGDLLPNATPSQLVATGFNRCNVTTSEGGAIDDEFLFRYAVDRTSTTIQTWLGLTGGCAVCHDHKYDPLSMKEFYSMYAFFYSAADPAMDGNVINTAPFTKIANQSELDALSKFKTVEQQSLETLRTIAKDQAGAPMLPQEVVVIDDVEPLGASIDNSDRFGLGTPWNTKEAAIPSGRRCITQRFGDKVELTIKNWLTPIVVPADGTLRLMTKVDQHEPSRAIFVELSSANVTKRFSWCNEQEFSVKVGSKPEDVLGTLPVPGQWRSLEVDLISQGFKAGDIIQTLKLGQFGGVVSWDRISLSGSYTEELLKENELKSWWLRQKGKSTPLADGELAQAIQEGPESELGKKLSAEVEAFHRAFIALNVSSEVHQARERYLQSKVETDTAERSLIGSLIFRDLPNPRQAFIMKRGQYDAPGDPVSPDTPAAFPKLVRSTADRTPNRLDLANWLVDGQNPIVARVTVNRYWQQVFGTGLVKTSDDFGSQGSPPSHPELLDWIAFHFQSNGWNVKQLMKTLVMTKAFQREAATSQDAHQQDPENRFLARGPRIRLDAEQIRDNVLAVSGLLNRTLGGPGFKGYQPPNIWEPVGYGDSNTRYYLQDHGDDLYRRSIYSFIKRTAPPPFMSNFDAPNREMFCTRRERSNTPLQALQLMNDVQHIEAARVFAERVLRSADATKEDRLVYLFEEALLRKPNSHELELLQKAYDRAQQEYSSRPEDAKQLAQVGEFPASDDLPVHEVAALTLVANLVFNLDETINRN